MNYTTLIADKNTAGSIKSWVNHSLLDVVQVVEEAEALIAQTLRTQEMTEELSTTIGLGAWKLALPTGFLDPISVRDFTNEIELKNRDIATLEQKRRFDNNVLVTSIAYNYAIFANYFQFECIFEASVGFRIIYYKKPTALATATTNFLTDRYPHLLRVACMAKAWEFRGNTEQETKELTKLAAIIAKTNAEQDLLLRNYWPDNEVA